MTTGLGLIILWLAGKASTLKARQCVSLKKDKRVD
jgi:hypothetical protein